MDKLLTVAVIGTILGFATFLGFFLSSFYGHSFLGVPFLGNFLTMCGLIVFFINISLIFLLKAPRYNE
jgi:hypothetical protein